MRQGHEWFKLIPGNKKRKRYAKKNKTKQNKTVKRTLSRTNGK